MNVLELKEQLMLAIGDELGTYTENGKDTLLPSIWVAPPQVPAGFKSTGLECVIQGDPDERSMGTATGDSLAFEYWIVRLIQWDTSKRLYEAKQKLRKHFRALNTVVESTDIPPTDLNYAQCVIRIFDPVWVSQGR